MDAAELGVRRPMDAAELGLRRPMDAAELAFTPIVRQAELVRAGDVTPRELVEVYLERIARLDPEVNAWRIVFAERALAEADQAAARLSAGDERPLLGVPLAIKDNVDVAGDVTTHGTAAYGEPAREDSEVVRRVRAAGAIVLGRTNVPPLCAMAVTESAAFGITRNPWDLDRSPGGSSGGSAAAVAAGMVGAALGSDGAGSIRSPSASCGLFGLKPQRGRISLAPLGEHWHGLTVLGWIARDVGDSALLCDLTMGPAAPDRDRPPPPPRAFAESAAAAPGRLRIAWSVKPPPDTLTRVRPEVSGAVRATAELLASLGHEVVQRDPDYGFGSLPASIRLGTGARKDAATLPRRHGLERRFRRVTAAAGLLEGGALARARAAEAGLVARLGRLFADHDVLLTPVVPEPPIEIGRFEGRGAVRTVEGNGRLIPFTVPWNQTGQPAASVPAGWTEGGLPLAVQVVGRPGDEGTVLSLAAQLQAERPWADRRPPIA